MCCPQDSGGTRLTTYRAAYQGLKLGATPAKCVYRRRACGRGFERFRVCLAPVGGDECCRIKRPPWRGAGQVKYEQYIPSLESEEMKLRVLDRLQEAEMIATQTVDCDLRIIPDQTGPADIPPPPRPTVHQATQHKKRDDEDDKQKLFTKDD